MKTHEKILLMIVSAFILFAAGKGLTSVFAQSVDLSPRTFNGFNYLGVLSYQTPAADTLACSAMVNGVDSNFATTYTLPANFIDVGKIVRVSIGYEHLGTGAGANLLPKVKLGGTAIYTSIVANPNLATPPNEVGLQLIIGSNLAPGAAVAVKTALVGGFAPLSRSSTTFSTTQATNGTLAIQPTFQCTATTAGVSLQLTSMLVEGSLQ